MSLIFLLHPFFLLPCYTGQIISYRHKTTCKRHQCHLFREFARLILWSPSRHSSTHNQYGHWKPGPAWSISAAPISYLWGFSSTHSFYQGTFFSPRHSLKMCLCPVGCSALSCHKMCPYRGLAAAKSWKLKEYTYNVICARASLVYRLLRNPVTAQAQMKQQSLGGLYHQSFLSPVDGNMTHVSLNLRANKLWKPLRNSEAVAVFCGIECQRSKLVSVKCSNFAIFQLHTTRKHLILSHTSPGAEASHSFAAKAKVGNLHVIYRENSN